MTKWKVTLRTNTGKVFCGISEGNTEAEARAYVHSRWTVNILKIRKIEDAKC